MKRYIIILTLLSSITLLGYSQNIDEVFKTMPDEFLPAFSEANKTMLLVDSSLSVIPYELGEVEKLKYSDTFLSLRTSDVGTMQIKILPLVNETKIIALIKTVCGNVCDSNIRFFTSDWKAVEEKSILPKIPPQVFFDKNKVETPQFKWATSHIAIYPLKFQFKEGSTNLEVKFDILDHLSSKDSTKIAPYLMKESIDLSWNKSTFVF